MVLLVKRGTGRGTQGSVCVQQAGLTISEKDVTPCGLESSSSSSSPLPSASCLIRAAQEVM